MKLRLLSSLVLVLVFTLGFLYQEVNAIPSYSLGKIVIGSVLTNSPKLITIDLSNQCLALVKHNQTDDCPSYKPIIKYDNSSQYLSGRFIETAGFLHRTISHTLNHYKMYSPDKWTVMVDPDSLSITHSKEITIVPHGSLNYINKNEVVNKTNIRTEYHDRYVDPSCIHAEIVYSDFLLKDTISYLESGCKTTSFKEKVIKETPHKTPSISNSPYSSNGYNKLSSKLKTSHIGLCIANQCNMTTSSKKW